MKLALLLVGFGHVARRFVALLDEMRPALASLDIDPVVVGITTLTHGSAFEAAGLDAVQAAQRRAEGDAIGPVAASLSTLECLRRLDSQSIETRVLVETTTLDIQSGEPAVSHVADALARGVHVITANKGPVAFRYRGLKELADAHGVSFLFEGAVMDGIPIFNLVRETLPGATIRGFRGVVNSTTNHILTALEQGEPFDRALARMQADGVAEADPTLDILGWDAAAKTAALANVLLDAGTTPRLVAREGIGPATAGLVRAARASGKRLKLVGRASRGPSGVDAAVELVQLDPFDPLGSLDGQGNALELDTWPLGRIVITQRDGGMEKTAYALFADLVTVARRVSSGWRA
jgi:homoserine dehydrogenase